jgi:2,4-dienoyl-CoA reductase-like NADH-dependent reductase (Old Yellow Enzyme family)
MCARGPVLRAAGLAATTKSMEHIVSSQNFEHLLTPLTIGKTSIRNRIVFTAHDALLQEHGKVSDRYIAYQVARARGGAGLQILAGSSIDSSAHTFEFQLRLDTDDAIPGFRRMADAVHAEGGVVLSQLLHAGRECYDSSDGSRPVAYSASATPSERHQVFPRELSIKQIQNIIDMYGKAAGRSVTAGMDGVEINANQGNLPAQFLANSVNVRSDRYGGSAENRQRFLIEVVETVRNAVGPDVVVGVRISATDMDHDGVEEDETLAACLALDRTNLIDYLHVVLGTGSTRGGATHIVPPMAADAGYVAPYAQTIRNAVKIPVIATGRFNTPHASEAALISGAADAVGMTRAMICDPDLARKITEKRADDIRACIGCDQACIGHLHKGHSVSCIQFPESGRELTLGSFVPATSRKRVLIAGGGPAGLKAAAVAAARGHEVILCEATGQLGGQANLAARLPGRAEFGGLITNLYHEAALSQVAVRLKTKVDRALVEAEKPDVLIIATGGRAALPAKAQIDGIQMITADELLSGNAVPGHRVAVADFTCDWVGMGVALHLATAGHDVTLAVVGVQPGEMVPAYVRDIACGRLFDAGVEVINYARLFGADGSTVYFEHVTALKPIIIEGIDTIVACYGAQSIRELEHEVEDLPIDVRIIGDCLAPRTAEEAVLDALKIASDI